MNAEKFMTPVLVVASVWQAADATQMKARPNIIHILADDMGWGDLGCYGHRSIQTPNIDRMAKEGTLYTQFYVNASVCSPSRAAFMTGQFPARLSAHTIYGPHKENQRNGMPDYLDPAIPNITRLLQDAGYATGHFGKWHLDGPQGAAAPGVIYPSVSEYGIDRHYAICSTGPSLFDSPGFKEAIKDETGFGYDWAYSSEAVVSETIRFIEDNPEKPFYINAWLLVPHSILNPTEEQMAPYKEKYGVGVVSDQGRYKPWPERGAMQIYYGTVTDMDLQIGRLLDYLDEAGLSDNTLVVFTADNGPESIYCPNASNCAVGMPGPFRGLKRGNYEGSVRAPFVARWPGKVPANQVDDLSVISGVDWLPTICSLAGVSLPEDIHIDGEDVSDILLGKSRSRTKPLFWEWLYLSLGRQIDRSPSLAVRDGDWKLLMNPDGSQLELYNILEDPSEIDNKADTQPDRVRSLSAKLLEWKEEVNSPASPPWARGSRRLYPWPETRK